MPCGDGETIFIPSKLYNELYRFKNFDLSNSSIHLKQKDYKLKNISINIDFLILNSDMTKCFSKPFLNDTDSKIKENEMMDDFFFKIFVFVIFSQNKKIEFPAYKIIELEKLINSNGENNG